MKIAVVGTGYVGLVTGAGFSDFGHDVTCVDIDAARVAKLRGGEVPFYEPGLHDLIRRNTGLGRLHFTTSTAEAVGAAQIVFIAVGTPSSADGGADLSYVLDAARAIGAALTRFTVIVTKSTVPIGTADRVRAAVGEAAKHPFAIASNPEFLKEGDAVNDFLKPARVVVGADDPRAIELLRELYRGVLRTSDRIQIMDIRSAELTKYAANCMLATRISFMNELARLCEATGADIEAVRKGIGSDPRIGSKFLFAGAGFGGSCFPKDLRALIHTARELDVQLGVVEAAERANERQKRVLGERVIAHFGGNLAGKRIALWGLAFKPETDDIRESPALALIEQVRAAGGTVAGYDPEAMPNVRALLGDQIELAKDAYAAASGADALALVTEWHELRDPDLARLRAAMRTPVLLDGRNVWPAADARAAGFIYYGIGRPGVTAAFFDLAAELAPLRPAIDDAIARVLDSGVVVGGPEVSSFERELAAALGASHALGVSSGTDALLAILMALGIEPGDEVVTTPFTFFATAGSAARLGARIVFADVDDDSLALSPRAAATACSKRTRAIVPVHLFGRPAALTENAPCPIVEDAAHLPGAPRGGVAAALSFFPTKNLGALGDAGAVVTDDPALADRIALLRGHGARPKYHHVAVGGNFRLDALQAAILRTKLPHLAAWTAARRAHAMRYRELFAVANLPPELRLPAPHPDHAYHQFVIRAPRRDALRAHLAAAGLETQVYYPEPLHLAPCFAALGYRAGSLPIAERASLEALALPIHPAVAPDTLARVVESIAAFYR